MGRKLFKIGGEGWRTLIQNFGWGMGHECSESVVPGGGGLFSELIDFIMWRKGGGGQTKVKNFGEGGGGAENNASSEMGGRGGVISRSATCSAAGVVNILQQVGEDGQRIMQD